MLELNQLSQLLAVAECGTISAAAERLHLSQPALSRSMQKLEEELQVRLFDRQKNRVALNPNGELAVEQARLVVEQAKQLVDQVRAFDRSRRTISFGSCAPAPLWKLVPLLSGLYPEMTVSSELKEKPQMLLDGLKSGSYQFVIFPHAVEDPDLFCLFFEKEQLYFALPPSHPRALARELHFADLDGESVLLLSQIGFWREVCRQKMPLTRALVQNHREDFEELAQASSLPVFSSDLTMQWSGKPKNRVVIPIADREATLRFHFLCRREDRITWEPLLRRLAPGQAAGS